MPASASAAAKPASGDRHGFAFTSSTHGVPSDGDAQIDSRVAFELEGFPAAESELDRARRERGVPHELAHRIAALEAVAVPLRRVTDDLRLPGREIIETDLGDRQRRWSVGRGDDRHVELAARHVRFSEPPAAEFGGARIEQRPHTGLVAHHRGVVEAQRRVLPDGLHDPWALLRAVRHERRRRRYPGAPHVPFRGELVRR